MSKIKVKTHNYLDTMADIHVFLELCWELSYVDGISSEFYMR